MCFLAFVTGRFDLMAIIAARSPEEYSHFLESELYAIPGILRTEGFVNLDVIKGSASLPDTTQLVRNFDISSRGKTRKSVTRHLTNIPTVKSNGSEIS
ncbi:hypothetical protein ES703_113775 [subsurface metagenome]